MPTVYFKTNPPTDMNLPHSEDMNYYLNLIISEMADCLHSNGVNFVDINRRQSTSPQPFDVTDAVEINLAINPMSGPISCETEGMIIYFTPGNPMSKRLATTISKNMENIYPDPFRIKLMPLEFPNVSAENIFPSITIGTCYAENPENVAWLRENTEEIARGVVMSIMEYFGRPFTPCKKHEFGVTNQDTSTFKRPNLNSEIVESLKANTKVKIVGQWEDWYIIYHNNNLGYVQTQFITTATS